MLGKLIPLSKKGEEKQSLPVVNLHFFIGSDLFCDIRINHKDIAAQHCLITSQKNKPALIRNLSRTVPTLVNNTEIGSSDVELKDNDIITVRHKNYKWCYDSSSSPSTSQSSFVVTSKNRKSWPLFKNKLVAVVTPHRRDEQNEVLSKKKRTTIAEENISKRKSAPKVLAIKSGLRATNKRKSSVKNAQNISPIEGTPKVLPSLNRKSVKFLDTSAPRSRLGKRGRKSSYATPYKCTPAKQKVSVYSTPPSSFRIDKSKPIKSILKTPSSSSTTPRKDESDEQHSLRTSDILATPLSNVPEVSEPTPVLMENDLLHTPVKGDQPEIVMRSSRRKAAIIRSPPSTPKSITKKRKSPEEKSIEASERAAKKLKKGPPHAIDKKKRAALLQCHRKSLTPHPVARRSGKLITNFPSSFSSRLETTSPARTMVSPKFNNSRKSESLKLSTDILAKYSPLAKHTDSEMILHNSSTSKDKIKPRSWKNSNKSISKVTSPIVRKLTRASRAARISNSLPQKGEVNDVLSALHLSRRCPSPFQGEGEIVNNSQDVSNLSGFKKLFSVDKTLDVRELFLEKNSESEVAAEKSFQSLSENQSERVSRRSAVLQGKQSSDKEELMHSFQSEGARDMPCSVSLLSESLSSIPSYSSTSRRSLSLKRGRKSTLSPKDINSSSLNRETEEQSVGKETTQSSNNENVETNVLSFSRKGRRSLSILNGSSFENIDLMDSSESSCSSNILNISNETHKKSNDTNNFSSPLNYSSSDGSVFSLGSFNSSYHKSRSGDSLSLLQASDINLVDKETFLEESVGGAKDVRLISPITAKGHGKGRISLRRAVLLASTPKPGKLLSSNESLLSLEQEVDKKEKSIHESGSKKLRSNRSLNLSTDVVCSGKLKKIMKKGKGFIAKSSLRFASLPLTTDSSVLKNLSAISTSIGDLRTTRGSKVNWNGSKQNSLKISENLRNNNIDSSITVVSTIQSARSSKSIISDYSLAEEQSKGTLPSSVNNSLGKSKRPSKLNVEPSQIELSTNVKKHSQSLSTLIDDKTTPKRTSNILQDSNDQRGSSRKTTDCEILNRTQIGERKRGRISKLTIDPQYTSKKHSRSLPNEQVTTKQTCNVSENFLHFRRSSRRGGDSTISKTTLKDTSFSTPLMLPDKTISDEGDIAPLIIIASPNISIRRRGRSSKLTVQPDNSQLEKSTTGKKRSRSLPSSTDSQTSLRPKQSLCIVEDYGHLRYKGRKGDHSVISNMSHVDVSSSSSLTLTGDVVSDKADGAIPNVTPTSVIIASSNTSIRRRGRSSKLIVEPDNSQLEKSTNAKKRSRSLPSSTDGQTTPKQSLSIVEDPLGHPRRSSRKGDHSVISNKSQVDFSSSSPSTSCGDIVSDKADGATPNVTPTTIIIASNTSIRRRGRSSKLIVEPDNSQLEKSTVVKKRSQSLPYSTDGQTTPKQSLSILEDPLGHPRRSSRKEDHSVISNMSNVDVSSSSLLTLRGDIVSDKADGATPNVTPTPIIITSSNTSIRRGRSSKLIVEPDDSQLEKSSIVKKRSRSLPSSTDGQTTPKQSLSIVEDPGRPRRSSKKGDHSIISNMSHVDVSSSSPLTLLGDIVSDKADGATPVIIASPNTSIRRGRSSKLSVEPDNSQLEKSSIVKKRSRSLPSSTDGQTTPKQSLSIVEDPGRPRRSSKKGDQSLISNMSHVDVSSSSPLTLLGDIVSDKADGATPNVTPTPIIITSSNTSIRRGRSSKLIVEPDDSQLEKSSIVKKRSRSLPSSTDGQTTPKQSLSIVEDPGRPRRSSKKGDQSLISNMYHVDVSSSSPLTLRGDIVSDKADGATPVIIASPNTSIRRGRSSKLTVEPDDSQLETSTIVKKRSRSLPSSTDGQTTPKQSLSIVEDPGRPRRSSRKGDHSVISKNSHVNVSSSSPLTLPEETVSDKADNATPSVIPTSIIIASHNTSIRRRGRSSKLTVEPDNSPLEKSTTAKKRSTNISSSTEHEVTPKQSLSIIDPDCSRYSSRKGGNCVLSSKSHFDGATPVATASFNTISIGRRGRSSKLTEPDNSQLEISTIAKKRSQSLSSSKDNKMTPKQSLSIVEYLGRSKRFSRKEDKSYVDASFPLPFTLSDKTLSDQEDYANVSLNTSSNTSSGRQGRPSKLTVEPDNSHLEKSAIAKKRSRSLPSLKDGQTTPKQSLSIVEDPGRSRRSSRKGDHSVISNKSHVNASFSSPFTSCDKSISEKEDPSLMTSSNISSGRKGRPSLTEDQTTHIQALSILEDPDRPKRNSRKVDDSVISSKSLVSASSSLSSLPNETISYKKDGATPSLKASSNTSVGDRGRPSKLAVESDNSLLEKSAIVKKQSRSLPSLKEDQARPKLNRSRKGDHSVISNNSHVDVSSSSPLTLPGDIVSDKAHGATPNVTPTPVIIASPNTSIRRRGRSSKLTVEPDNSQLEKSTIVQKHLQSLPATDGQTTPKQSLSIVEDPGRPRRSSKKGDHSVISNMSNVDVSSLSLLTLRGDIVSNKADGATPNVTPTPIIITSPNTSIRRGRSSKLSVEPDNSQLEKSSIVIKSSRSLPSSTDDQTTPKQSLSIVEDPGHPRRSSKKGDHSVISNLSNVDVSSSSPLTLHGDIVSDKADGATAIIIASPNTSIRRGRSSKLSVEPDNSQLEKSSIVKKRSRSLPSSTVDQSAPKQASNILEDSSLSRRSSSRKGEDSKISMIHASSSSLSIFADKKDGTSSIIKSSPDIRMRKGDRVSATSVQFTSGTLLVPIAEKSPHKRESVRKKRSFDFEVSAPSSDHSEGTSVAPISPCEFKKSKKRKLEVSSESGPKNRVSFYGSSDDNIFSLAKKKVKKSNSDSFPIFSDNFLNNKRFNYLDTNAGNSKTFGAFSSTPIIEKKTYLLDSCEGKNRSRSKFKNVQSPVGLSPILGSDEADFSENDENSQISMICLRHSKCPSDIEEKSKSGSFVFGTNILSVEENKSQNYIKINDNSSSNHDTNNSNVKLGKKTPESLSTSKKKLPFVNQTPLTSQLSDLKEDKSLRFQHVRKSDYSIPQGSNKDEMINISLGLRSNPPNIEFSSGKSRTRSRKICNDIESIDEKKENTIVNENELSPSFKRLPTDNKSAHMSIKSPSKTSEQNVLLVKSPVPPRRGRPPKSKDISEINTLINKALPVSQRRGRSAKNVNLSTPFENTSTTDTHHSKSSKKKYVRKTIIAENPSSSSKQHEVENIITVSEQMISKNVDRKSPVTVPKTRSKIAVLALKTPSKSAIISSPIVKSSSLNRRRVGRTKSENILSPPHAQKLDHSAKEDSITVTSEDLNVLLHKRFAKKEIKRKINKAKNSSPLQEDIKIENSTIVSSPAKRRGRSAKNNSSSRREKQVDITLNQDIVTSSHLPKRGRPIKAQHNINNIFTKEKDLNEVIEEPNNLPSQKRGRSVKKDADSSNKRRNLKKDPANNNETIISPSLPKRGRPTKVQDSNLSVSDNKAARNISISAEAENTYVHRGRSVITNSSTQRANSKKEPVNSNELIASPSLSLPRRGRRAKVQDSITTVSGKKTASKKGESTSLLREKSVVKNSDSSPKKRGKHKTEPVNNNETITSPSISLPKRGRRAIVQNNITMVSGKKTATKEDESTSFPRERSVIKNSDSSPKKRGKPKKEPLNNNETIASLTLTKRGRPHNEVQDSVTTDSKKKQDQKGSEMEEVQTNTKRRGRSAAREQRSPPDKRKRPIPSQSESDKHFNDDSLLPKRGRSAKRAARDATECTDDLSNSSVQKREKIIVLSSNSPPVKRGKSKKNPTDNNAKMTSPSVPKRGRSAKIQEGAINVSVKGTTNKFSKSIDENILPSQRRGRSAAIEEHSLDRKRKSKQDIEKKVTQISSSKKEKPVVSENVSPRRGRSVASKQNSPLSVKKKLSCRRGNRSSSQPEIRKVSERSKVIKKNSKIKENKPLKSAIKKSLSKRFSRKSSLVGFIKPGRRKVHFNKNLVRNSNSKKK